MALTPPIKDEEATAEQAEMLEWVKSRRNGTAHTEFRMMARAPQFARDALALQDAHLHAEDGVLDGKTREAIALAVSVANGCTSCVKSHARRAQKVGWSEADVTAILGLVSQCSMLNAYHRHRELDPTLMLPKQSGLPFGFTQNPPIEKRTAELIGVVVSGVNGCPACVRYHTDAARTLGVTDQQLHEAVRVGAAMTMFNAYFRIQ